MKSPSASDLQLAAPCWPGGGGTPQAPALPGRTPPQLRESRSAHAPPNLLSSPNITLTGPPARNPGGASGARQGEPRKRRRAACSEPQPIPPGALTPRIPVPGQRADGPHPLAPRGGPVPGTARGPSSRASGPFLLWRWDGTHRQPSGSSSRCCSCPPGLRRLPGDWGLPTRQRQGQRQGQGGGPGSTPWDRWRGGRAKADTGPGRCGPGKCPAPGRCAG